VEVTLFRVYALAQTLGFIGLWFLPHWGFLWELWRVACGWGAAVFIFLGMRRHRPVGRSAHYIIGAGVLINVGGILVETVLNAFRTDDAPTSLADVFFLMFYPALALGMTVLVRRRRAGSDRAALLDTTIITVGLGLLWWVFLIRPQADRSGGVFARAVQSAYPIGDLIVLGMMVRLLVGGDRHLPSLRMMLGALLFLLVGDGTWTVLSHLGGDAGPLGERLLAVNYQIAYSLLAASALHPSVRFIAEPSPPTDRIGRPLLVGLTLASLIAPALLIGETLHGRVADALAIGLGSAVLFLLVVTRMSFLLRSLEQRTAELAARNRATREVLDTVTEGLVRVAADGTMAEERSAVVDRWFGPFRAGLFADYIAAVDATYAELFELGLEQWREGILPADLCLEQLPRRLHAGERELTVRYLPVGGEGLLLVIVDVTDQRQLAREEARQRELLAVFQGFARDRVGLLSTFEEASGLVERLAAARDDLATHRRLLHTLKGNASLVGFDVVAGLCHTAEEELDERPVVEATATIAALRERWRVLASALADLSGERGREMIELEPAELDRLCKELGPEHEWIVRRLESWRCEPVARPLARLALHARALARRLGRGELIVDVQASDVRLDARRWRSLWAEMAHVVNNAVDHGIEDPVERRAARKAAAGRLRLAAQIREGDLVIELEDDGRGIDWEAIRASAARMGLPSETPQDLTAALLAPGLTTRQEVSLVSGRGLGMSAVYTRTRELNGRIDVSAAPGDGTCWRLSFPVSTLARHEGPSEGS
jgi:HPt (histidine-containing phosphotransfer) domain-containing protein